MSRRRALARGLVQNVALVCGVVAGLIELGVFLTPLPAELSRPAERPSESLRVLDRRGVLLREVRADDHTRAAWLPFEEIGSTAINALVAAEDQRFFAHRGVDELAVLRAALGNVTRGRITSGASTLTMQLARLVQPHPRTFVGKVQEALLAMRIERSVDKQRVLTEYFNRAPFGPGIRGIGAASHVYFDKAPRALTVAEAALLASLPKGPAIYDPVRKPERVAARRDVVLTRMHALAFVDDQSLSVARAEPSNVRRVLRPRGAVHFVSAVLDGRLEGAAGARGIVTTTLDAELQAEAEQAVRSQVASLGARHVTAGAALVVDNASGEIRAWVGSPDAYDRAHAGWNDGVLAARQAGSTLKPFLYGLAFEREEIDAATALADAPTTIALAGGAFVPANYDGKFHGPVRARVALGSSLNVPAVNLAERVGVGDFLNVLRRAGFALPERPDHYGAALALGDGEVTLLELVRAYVALARDGRAMKLHAAPFARNAEEPAERVLSARAAWLVRDILADKEARLPAFGERNVLELPFRASVKTGTSKGFRDNWAVGVTERFTAGVWVGNFDGSSMRDVSGITGAGPALRAILVAAEGESAQLAVRDRDHETAASLGLVRAEVCPVSGRARGPACTHGTFEWLPRARAEHREACNMHGIDATPRGTTDVRIEHPAPASRYYLSDLPAPTIGVRARAPRNATTVSLVVDGHEVSRARPGEPLVWRPQAGRHSLVAMASPGGASEAVTVDVE